MNIEHSVDFGLCSPAIPVRSLVGSYLDLTSRCLPRFKRECASI